MAQKHGDGHATAHLYAPPIHVPPAVTPSDNLLASAISLPSDSRIAYVTFVPASDGPSYDILELGRRQLVSRNESLTLLESILPHVHVDGASPALHAFTFTTLDHSDACLSTLRALLLDGLVDLSAATLLPRQPLRIICSRFINALRSRLIDDITRASKDAVGGRPARRLMDGFLLMSSPISNEWATDWLNVLQLRPLVHCQLEVHLSASRLEIYSQFRPTDLLPIDFSHPLAPGTPMTLLPFGVPSYYLSAYNGPTSGITCQFEQSLVGLGAGDWKSSLSTRPERHNAFHSNTPKQTSPAYVIAWIAVQNKQGEDKGIAIIWPLQLCLAFTVSPQPTHVRRPLPYLPDLPPQLQPSPPPPPPPFVAAVTLSLSSSGEDNLHAIHTPSVLGGCPISRRSCASPTSESVRAFRCLTLSKSSKVESVASEIGLYVESVAKEREKERERIRRERENAQSSASPRTVATPSASTSVPPSVSVPITSNSPVAISPINGNLGNVQIPLDPVQATIMVATDVNTLPPCPYPSPPSPSGKVTIQPNASNADSTVAPEPPSHIEAPSSPPRASFDPFGSIETTWTQPSNDFMQLDEAYDIGFDMNVDNMGTTSGGRSTNTGHADMDFEDGFIFTDDDFDFFDRPSVVPRTIQPVIPAPEESSSLTHPASGPMGFSPSILGDAPFTPGQHHTSPFSHGGAGDPFTPRVSDLYHMQDSALASADAVLPSPGPTPNSQPTTPQITLSLENRKGAVAPSFFDPIPFAQSHTLSDSKYHSGKFALPSPPDEEDRTRPIPHHSSPDQDSRWRSRYDAATDPRIGLVKKLIGVKRKSAAQGSRSTEWRPSWLQHTSDGEYPVSDDAEDTSDVPSDDEDIDTDGVEPVVPSRTTTPPPAYLPLGPTLLHMRFSHPHLLPLSRPLRPPGAAVAPMTIPVHVPTSVPTPVSPAAALGASSEKSKSLEAAGSMIAREAVENSMFFYAWRASNASCPQNRQLDVWPSDISVVTQIIRDLPAVDGPMELQTFLHHGSGSLSDLGLLQRMETPVISVGKGDSIIQVLPSSLRFWEKLGLTPQAGKKNLTAFLFFEDNGMDKQTSAETWLRKLSTTYSARQLGSHTAGSHSLCSVDGIFALRLDSLRKYLASFAADFPELDGLIFYIAVPDSALTLASPLLRQIASAMKRLQKIRAAHPVTLQLIPEHHITSYDLGTTDFERLCFSVYHRVPQLVGRTMSRKMFDTDEDVRGFFREPAFTLARPPKPAVHFNLGPACTLDVLDRHTFLHVGYRFSACGKWILVACIDQRGESYDLGSWLTQDEVETSAVLQVWDFALQTARRTNIEWRLVISKLGPMSPAELDAWIHCLSASPGRDRAPFHVTISSIDQNISWSLTQLSQPNTGQQTPSRRATGKDSLSKSLYMDVTTATTYAVYPTIRIPLSTPPAYPWADSPFIPDQEGILNTESTCPLLPVRSAILLHVPSKRASSSCPTLHIHFLHSYRSPASTLLIPDDVTYQEITRNFYELAVLASLQGPFGYPILPLHLAALESMQDVLRQEPE